MKAALSLIVIAGVIGAGHAAPAMAQQQVRQLVVYGHDPCPRSSNGDEIVICARKPETERYRIPQALRNAPSTNPENVSWANRAESLEYVGRTGIGSCSTSGPGGWTGCLNQLIQSARAERQQAAADAARVP